jgi:hypothetical protein
MADCDGGVGDIARAGQADAGTAFVDAVDPEVLPDGVADDLCNKRGEDERLHRCDCGSGGAVSLDLLPLRGTSSYIYM